jgi:hypothetical protein
LQTWEVLVAKKLQNQVSRSLVALASSEHLCYIFSDPWLGWCGLRWHPMEWHNHMSCRTAQTSCRNRPTLLQFWFHFVQQNACW